MSSEPTAPRGERMVSLADEDAVKQVLSSTMISLWEAVNTLTRLRPSRRERYRVAIFGSARAQPGSFAYEEVKRAAAAFTAMGCDIVTGGGPGLMQAANEGAASAGVRDQSIGIRVELPFEQEVNPFVGWCSRRSGRSSGGRRRAERCCTGDGYLVNSEKGRRAFEKTPAAETPRGSAREAANVSERPNVFALYEKNIGMLTPMVAEELKEAEAQYPAEWIGEAFQIAAENNKRSWSYARKILQRWQTEGRGDKSKKSWHEKYDKFVKR